MHLKNYILRLNTISFQKLFSSTAKENLEKHKVKTMAKGLPKVRPITGVKHVVLVSSGKGGVGKSTTAVNLAAALKTAFPSRSIGLLDTDVFGPSVPLMMNLNDTPLLNDKNLMVPLTNYGVKCMSMGFLVEDGAPIIWRGLMVMQALDKLLRQVDWDTLDYLIVDTPPGTGDTHLSLIQNIPIAGVILVTTPQTASLQVAKRGATMYRKLNVPIIGIVENMSSVTCSKCSAEIQLFGQGTAKLAEEIGADILQSFPLQHEISCATDKGIPLIVSHPQCSEALRYVSLGKQVVEFLERNK